MNEEYTLSARFGREAERYIKMFRTNLYIELEMDNEFYDYLVALDKKCVALEETLIEQYKKRDNVTSELQARDWTEYVRRLNTISHEVTNFIQNEYIYVAPPSE